MKGVPTMKCIVAFFHLQLSPAKNLTIRMQSQLMIVPEGHFPHRIKSFVVTAHRSSSSSLARFNEYNRIRHSGSVAAAASASSITLSTEEVIEIAAGRFIQILDSREEHRLRLLCSMLPQLPADTIKSVELVLLLLFSAEMTDQKQHEVALALLEQCRDQCSNVGTPVERLVLYFSEALKERIERKKQSLSSKQRMESSEIVINDDNDEEVKFGQQPGLFELRRIIPFCEVMQFTAAQVIAEHVAVATRIHLIDLAIMAGMNWTVLMQAFAARSRHRIKLLKISGVGTSREKVEEIGNQQQAFAEKLNLPFTFNAVIVSDTEDLKEQSFGVKAGEVLAIHAPVILRKMISRQDGLEKMIRLMRRLNPCVMTVSEIQASHNSTAFIKRFTEALFFFGAWFDCTGICMKDNDVCRMSVESQVFRSGIQLLIGAEETDSTIRHAQIDVWRLFFTRSGFVELDLGHRALYQAQLISDQYPCGSCCTAAMNGKSLTIGWKGTPLHFLTAWKLQR